MKYKTVLASNGRRMYYVDGKLTKKDDVPEEIQTKLVDGEELDTSEEEAETPKEESSTRSCVLCGEPATTSRSKNGKIFRVCLKHHRVEYLKDL